MGFKWRDLPFALLVLGYCHNTLEVLGLIPEPPFLFKVYQVVIIIIAIGQSKKVPNATLCLAVSITSQLSTRPISLLCKGTKGQDTRCCLS